MVKRNPYIILQSLTLNTEYLHSLAQIFLFVLRFVIDKKYLFANKSCVHSVSFLLLHFCWNCEHLSQGGQVGDKVRILTGQQQAKKLDLFDLDKTEDVRPNKF